MASVAGVSLGVKIRERVWILRSLGGDGSWVGTTKQFIFSIYFTPFLAIFSVLKQRSITNIILKKNLPTQKCFHYFEESSAEVKALFVRCEHISEQVTSPHGIKKGAININKLLSHPVFWCNNENDNMQYNLWYHTGQVLTETFWYVLFITIMTYACNLLFLFI